MPEKEIKWTAPEFEYHHKRVSWYWLVIIFTIVIIAFALWQQNFLFAVFVFISAFLVIKLGYQTPRYLDFHLTSEGLLIDQHKFYPYENLAGFATRRLDSFDDGLSELILKKKHRFSTYLKVIIPTEHLEEIRTFVNQHLPEIEYEESLTDHISKLLRF